MVGHDPIYIIFMNFFPPPIAFFVLQKGIEGGLEEIVVCGVVCIVYSILPLHVLLNLKQVLVLHVGKNVSVLASFVGPLP